VLLNFQRDLGFWLNTIALPEATWIKRDLGTNPPIPQDFPLYGYFTIINTERPMIPYADEGTYNISTDKFDFKSYSSIIATVRLDLYSFDLEQSSINGLADVLTRSVSHSSLEYFMTKEMGLCSWSDIRNLSAVEAANVKKREVADLKFNVVHVVDDVAERVVNVPIQQNVDVDGTIVTTNYTIEDI